MASKEGWWPAWFKNPGRRNSGESLPSSQRLVIESLEALWSQKGVDVGARFNCSVSGLEEVSVREFAEVGSRDAGLLAGLSSSSIKRGICWKRLFVAAILP